jgi:subtilisin family serine protease
VAALRRASVAALAAAGLLLAAGTIDAAAPPFYTCPAGLVATGSDDPLANGSNCAFWLLDRIPSGDAGTSLPGLDVLPVWKQTQGQGVTVAVLDSGIDAAAADLQPNLLPGRNLLDGGTDSSDESGHGTLVASLIAAAPGNGGYVGIAPQAKLLPVKIIGGPGGSRLGNRAAVAGIRYALARGARVINCSFGSFGAAIPGMHAALAAAAKADVLIVIAAGNEHASLDRPGTIHAPDGTGFANTLTVANLAVRSGELAADSNWGARDVQVASLGDYLYGDLPGNPTGGYLGGSSAAAATVAGVAALLRAAYPQATAVQVVRAIRNGSTPLPALQGKVGSGGLVSASGALAYLAAHH